MDIMEFIEKYVEINESINRVEELAGDEAPDVFDDKWNDMADVSKEEERRFHSIVLDYIRQNKFDEDKAKDVLSKIGRENADLWIIIIEWYLDYIREKTGDFQKKGTNVTEALKIKKKARMAFENCVSLKQSGDFMEVVKEADVTAKVLVECDEALDVAHEGSKGERRRHTISIIINIIIFVSGAFLATLYFLLR